MDGIGGTVVLLVLLLPLLPVDGTAVEGVWRESAALLDALPDDPKRSGEMLWEPPPLPLPLPPGAEGEDSEEEEDDESGGGGGGGDEEEEDGEEEGVRAFEVEG